MQQDVPLGRPNLDPAQVISYNSLWPMPFYSNDDKELLQKSKPLFHSVLQKSTKTNLNSHDTAHSLALNRSLPETNAQIPQTFLIYQKHSPW